MVCGFLGFGRFWTGGQCGTWVSLCAIDRAVAGTIDSFFVLFSPSFSHFVCPRPAPAPASGKGGGYTHTRTVYVYVRLAAYWAGGTGAALCKG